MNRINIEFGEVETVPTFDFKDEHQYMSIEVNGEHMGHAYKEPGMPEWSASPDVQHLFGKNIAAGHADVDAFQQALLKEIMEPKAQNLFSIQREGKMTDKQRERIQHLAWAGLQNLYGYKTMKVAMKLADAEHGDGFLYSRYWDEEVISRYIDKARDKEIAEARARLKQGGQNERG